MSINNEKFKHNALTDEAYIYPAMPRDTTTPKDTKMIKDENSIKHVVSFSGGKDSTAMLLMMIEKGVQIDRIICIDTTKEFPGMIDHIQKVVGIVKPLKIEIIKINFDYWFSEHIKTKGKWVGKQGYGWPDFRNRWCTALKREASIKTVHSNDAFEPCKRGRGKLVNKDVIEYHGIAYDEKERCNNNKDRNIRYPLVEWKITEKQALAYCYSRGFYWDGLYEKFFRVSCWCCPLSRIGELRILYRDFPHLWNKLREMDKKSFRKFRSDYSVSELEEKFKGE